MCPPVRPPKRPYCDGMRWTRRLGVRLRSALAAAAVSAAALVVVAVVFVFEIRSALTDGVDTAAVRRAEEVAAAVRSGDRDAVERAVRAGVGDGPLVQVVAADGTVTAASDPEVATAPMSPLRPAAGQVRREDRRLDDDAFRVVALGLDEQVTVLVGQSLEPVGDGTEAVTDGLSAGLPVVVLLVGAATFVFVGRALRPVEAMRQQAATIGATSLDARLPVPEARDEVARLAVTMNAMLDRIETANATQRQFVADAGHELRNPLATIHAGLELLGKEPAVQEQAARLRTESARMSVLVEDLLLLARADEHALRMRRQDVDVDDLVYAERAGLAARRPDLTVRVDVRPARVVGDAEHLRRMLRNLTDNAARHARSVVSITVAAEADSVVLHVSDDGPGVPAEQRERVFDRFVRLDDSRSRGAGGAGLGLAIVRQIVTAHDGRVTILDTPATTFAVSLPRAPA